jgi:cytochrome b
MQTVRVWDPLVRLFHWSLVIGFAANALIVPEDSRLHIWIGYGIVGLVAVRVLWGFFGRGYERFDSFPPSLSGALAQVREIAGGPITRHRGHTPLGAWMIYNLIVTLALIGMTGHMMTMDAFWGLEWPEELHEAVVSWAEISVVAHIVAVIVESRRTRTNLPLAMVTGYKTLPTE